MNQICYWFTSFCFSVFGPLQNFQRKHILLCSRFEPPAKDSALVTFCGLLWNCVSSGSWGFLGQVGTNGFMCCVSAGTKGDIWGKGAQGPTASVLLRALLPQVLQHWLLNIHWISTAEGRLSWSKLKCNSFNEFWLGGTFSWSALFHCWDVSNKGTIGTIS